MIDDAAPFVRMPMSGDPDRDLPVLGSAMAMLGEPIHVFVRHPFWKPLISDPTRPPGRSSGIGFNSLHIDCVNVEYPPDVVVLYCVREDPLGGGHNLLAVTDGLEDELSPTALNLLSSIGVSEGAAYDLAHVGEGLTSFTIHTSGLWPWRYSGRMLESNVQRAPNFVEALLEIDRALMHRAEVIRLRTGEALFINQRRVLHGRLPLGRGQAGLPLTDRRELVQAYVRLP